MDGDVITKLDSSWGRGDLGFIALDFLGVIRKQITRKGRVGHICIKIFGEHSKWGKQKR